MNRLLSPKAYHSSNGKVRTGAVVSAILENISQGPDSGRYEISRVKLSEVLWEYKSTIVALLSFLRNPPHASRIGRLNLGLVFPFHKRQNSWDHGTAHPRPFPSFLSKPRRVYVQKNFWGVSQHNCAPPDVCKDSFDSSIQAPWSSTPLSSLRLSLRMISDIPSIFSTRPTPSRFLVPYVNSRSVSGE